MKKIVAMIKSALGITQLEKSLNNKSDSESIKEEIANAVRAALSGKEPLERYYSSWKGWTRAWISDIVSEQVTKLARDEVRKQINEQVKEYVDREAILDDIVKRLRDKQLTQ